jgi:hypothetical protein
VSSSWLTNAIIVATALGAFTFCVAYAWRTRGAWRGSTVGINVMAFMAAILAVSCLAVAGIIWGTNWPHREVIRGAAWGLIAVCIWWRVAILLRVQHRD